MRIASVILAVALIFLQACTVNGSSVSERNGLSVTAWMPDVARMSPVPKYWPLQRSLERQTPLRFGLYVTPDPALNPIDPPERFTGYHAAIDFEILPGEETIDVPYAICSGPVMYAGFAEGYGGLVVQQCLIHEEEVTVLYGHLTLDSLPDDGEKLIIGQRLSFLAPARSYASGGNRKHLHLGIHRGPQLNVKGYVQQKSELKNYIDPFTILPLYSRDEEM